MTATKPPADLPGSPNVRAWIEDGILYTKLTGEISLEAVLAIKEQAMALIKQNNFKLIPAIVDLSEANDTSLKIHTFDIGKIFTIHSDTLKYTTGIWLVGASDNVRKLSSIASKMFMNGRLLHAETLEQAQSAARASMDIPTPILEQDTLDNV